MYPCINFISCILSSNKLTSKVSFCLCVCGTRNQDLQANLIRGHVSGNSSIIFYGPPGGSEGKESACNVGDPGSIPGLGISPRGGHGNPPQYSCLENSMDRGAWWVTVHGVTKSWTQLSN